MDVFRNVKAAAHAHDFVERFFLEKFIKKGTTIRKVPNGIMNKCGIVSHPQDMSRQTDLMIDPSFAIFNMLNFMRFLHVFRTVKATAHAMISSRDFF